MITSSDSPAQLTDRNFAGRYSRYPDTTGKRQAEGGWRLKGEVKTGMPDLPLVTIITVCWNSDKTIEQTIRSVAAQTYPNIEYVVVDGGSSDGTVDILRRHEPVIDYFVSEPDEGLYYAMNKGLELAQGDLILLLNSDDWLTSDAIEALVEARNYSGCDFTSALARYVDEDGSSSTMRTMPFDDAVHLRMPLRHETMLIPAWLYNKVGPYNTDYRIIADRALTAQLFEAGATLYEVPRPLLYFRTTGVSSTDLDRLAQERDLITLATFPFLTKEEAHQLDYASSPTPDNMVRIANAHLDQPGFVKAVRALLHDRRENAGKRWQTNDVEDIGAGDPLNWPSVSVIVPFYEAQDTIATSLDSVLAQSLTAFEIICVNDCAIDESQAVVDRYMAQDKRIRCVQNPRNLGLGASRNAGIRAARGRYIFHLDPDDALPGQALEKLHSAAKAHGSDLIKGAYERRQGLHSQAVGKTDVNYPAGVVKQTQPNTNLKRAPRLLHATEGHWSYLYDGVFASRVPYPTDLKMGQDSIFMVNAVVRARTVTLVPEVIYHYEANPKSAMNSFTARKYFDGLEWRRRAWHVLRDAGMVKLGERLLFSYWSEDFFAGLDKTLTPAEHQDFERKLGEALKLAHFPSLTPTPNKVLRDRFDRVLAQLPAPANPPEVNALVDDRPMRVATLTTQDHGGAGLGSMRRVEALRRHGVDARIRCIFQKASLPYVHQVPLRAGGAKGGDVRIAWRDKAVLTRKEHPKLRAYEMFSKTGSIVNFRDLKPMFKKADIVHMHWVSGLFDFDNTDVLKDKPVAWTLADMNAFTGGCHYAEGCTGYRTDCRNCPLLEKGSNIAHENWKIKRAAYDKIENLHVICPSQWLADCAKSSSLFGDRQVHMIPNALPVTRFTPTNRMVARQKLGLPLDRKLVVFGADSLNNRRKGGDILARSVKILADKGLADGVEGLFFGASGLDLGIPSHSMGHISDEVKMSLIYAAADVFAFPSREDNAPLTVVESLLSGTPVVAFDGVGNVPEMITHKDTGYIARYTDAADFAEGLAWALKNTDGPDILMRGLRGHVHARTHNDPDTAIARHTALYHKMLAK